MQTNIQQSTTKNTYHITYKSARRQFTRVQHYFESTNWYKKSNLPTPENEVKEFFIKIHQIMQQQKLRSTSKAELKPSVQRILDLVCAGVLAIPSAILVFISALITKMAQPKKTVFHKQHRYGLNGKKFYIIKIRTVDKTEDGWRQSSRFARLLRTYSIDELPQLLNVFKGNMSLMGPRAVIFKDLKSLTEEGGEEFIAQRLSYKPGFGFGYEKNRTLKKPRVDLEKDFFKNHGIKTYFETLISLAKTILKGNNG